MRFEPHQYQIECVKKILENSFIGLFLDMGLGKTVVTLTAVEALLRDYFAVDGVLVVAPKQVAESVWRQEAEKWDHLRGLRFSLIVGDRKRRLEAMRAKADVHVVSRDNVFWLVENCGEWKWDMLVLDELSSFKNPFSKRFKALAKARGFAKRVVGLTGTPAPNGLMDLWGEVFLLDGGERLGRSISEYRRRWFREIPLGVGRGRLYVPLPGAKGEVESRISDVCLSLKAADYLKMPGLMKNEIRVELDPKARAFYEKFRRDAVVEIQDGELTASSPAVLLNKLLQAANGAVYRDRGEEGFAVVHDAKIERLKEVVESLVDSGESVLVYYTFRHDRERILEAMKGYRTGTTDAPGFVEKWNSGGYDVLLAHPASSGSGLNLQAGGRNIVWFSLTWNLEHYEQANARLYRQGQTRPVFVHHLIAAGTVDKTVYRALENKRNLQDEILDAVRLGGVEALRTMEES